MCVQFLPSRANHQPPLEYSEIWRFLCKSNPILHVVRLAIFCRIPQSLTLLVVLLFIEFANLQSKIHDHLRISRDLIDSVLLCFKYPSLLYTLSETRGELVEILNSNSTFSTRERQNRNFWITDMTDFLNESWRSIVCKNILGQPFCPHGAGAGRHLLRPARGEEWGGGVGVRLFWVSQRVSEWVIRYNSIWSWYSVLCHNYYYCS